jgi:myo-inositol-1(or 4)-monophosphatase
VSIAVQIKGRVEHGAVYDPIQDELFTATRGSGAMLNDKRVRVGSKIKLDQALLATAFPFSNATLYERYMKEFANIYPQCSDIRRLGSAALDLCYVANDRFDGYFEYGIKLWDIAAGALIVQEAGGLVSDLNGGNDFTGANGILAANPKMYKAIAQALKGQ